MKKLVLISFDIIRPGEPTTAFAVGSLLSSLKAHPAYGDVFEVEHRSFNLFETPGIVFPWESVPINWETCSHVAVSCYIWGHSQAMSLMQWVKNHYPEIIVVAGGYQVNSPCPKTLQSLYPHSDVFITGYAERSLAEVMTGAAVGPVIQTYPDWKSLPSPIVSNEIVIGPEVINLRMESKRGCPFACTFCAQHEIGKPKPYYYSATRIEQELELISRTNVQRVSVTDPVFNIGSTYHDFLRAVEQKKMQGVFNFQVRPELVFKQSDTALLDLLAVTQSEIELGLQTFDAAVNKRIKRGNHYEHIEKAIEMMREREVHFGLSLIYGLPGQTLDSFKRDIDKVRHMGIEHVIAFPLMLLPGTELYVLKNEEGVRERPLGEYGIPHVVAGPGFTESEWEEMHELAQDLNPDGRLF